MFVSRGRMTGGRRKTRKPLKLKYQKEEDEHFSSSPAGKTDDRTEDRKGRESMQRSSEGSKDISEDEDNGEAVEVPGNSNGKLSEDEEDLERSNSSVWSTIGECTECMIELRDWPAVYDHLQYHRATSVPGCLDNIKIPIWKKFSCQVCQRNCQNKEVLAYHVRLEHMWTHGREASQKCAFCGKLFDDPDKFHSHVDVDVINFRCKLCNKRVKQEHWFYKHFASCAGQLSRDIRCVVCHKKTPSEELLGHLQDHNSLINGVKEAKSKAKMFKKEGSPERESTTSDFGPYWPFLCEFCDRRFVIYGEFKRHVYSHSKVRSYICTFCGRSYCQKNTLIVHLFNYHNTTAQPDDVQPKDDTHLQRCQACNRFGFANEELYFRHCLLRCPKRDNLQMSFGVILTSLAENLGVNYMEAVRSAEFQRYLKLGVEAWRTDEKPNTLGTLVIALWTRVTQHPGYLWSFCSTHNEMMYYFVNLFEVSDFLESLKNEHYDVTSGTKNRKDSPEFTDAQLLAWLDYFEDLKRKKDPELEFFLSQTQKCAEEVLDLPHDMAKLISIVRKEQKNLEEEEENYREAIQKSKLDYSPLLQHLQYGHRGQKRKCEEIVAPDQLDICLVTSKCNTLVTITPAATVSGQSPVPMSPPELANELKPTLSVDEIHKKYPGVHVFGGVDFSRVSHILEELAQYCDRNNTYELDPETVLRLEYEAQLLRNAQPFFVLEDESNKPGRPRGSISGNSPKKLSNIVDSPSFQRLLLEAGVHHFNTTLDKKGDRADSSMKTGRCRDTHDFPRLWEEAKNINV